MNLHVWHLNVSTWELIRTESIKGKGEGHSDFSDSKDGLVPDRADLSHKYKQGGSQAEKEEWIDIDLFFADGMLYKA